jgi:hypothetical protein
VRSEISGDTLGIRWKPSAQQLHLQQQQRIVAYKTYFNNEKCEEYAGQNDITFKKLK